MGKHASVVHSKKYSDGKLQGGKCPRCRTLCAKHENRITCGKCGYSSIAKS